MILHEEYKRSDVKHDIALLRIKPKEKRANQKTGIIFGSRVQPLCLPSSEIQHRAGMNCTISGWGSVNNEDLTISIHTSDRFNDFILMKKYYSKNCFSISYASSSHRPYSGR